MMNSSPGRGSPGMAVFAGLVVAIACALVWGVIAYATKYQLSIMAILVGAAVGWVMSRIGRIKSPAFALVSAALAVFGCALGSLVAEILVINRHGVALSEILAHLDVVFRFYPRVVGGLGFLFWVFAALWGYRLGMGNSMRWGWSRRMRPPRQPHGANQPYGTAPQPYGTPPQPYGTPPQPFGTPPQPYGTPAQGYGTPPQPSDPSAQPPYGTPAQDFGAAQPPYGTPPQPDAGLPPARPGDVTRPYQPPPGTGSS